MTEPLDRMNGGYEHSIFGLDASAYPNYVMVYLPHWLPAMIVAAIGTAPWLPWFSRFSLRTLLIATTLVAVVLGLIVWLR